MMKRIHFDNFHAKWYFVAAIVVCSLLLAYSIFTEGQGRYAKEFMMVSLLMAVVLMIRKNWYASYVNYTQQRMLIRINSSSPISIDFDELTSVELRPAQLLLSTNSNHYTVDVEDIHPEDVQALINLLVKHSEAFYKDVSQPTYYE
jgi:hypothetical protein